jgi:CRP/FNR family transcriptional regulator, cyclic AMP receptor protein
MPEQDLVRSMATHPMLALLPPQALEVLARTSRLVTYRAGRTVLREGDPPQAFCLLSGAARVFHRSGDQEVLVKLFRGPALGGEMEVLCKRPFLVNMRTLESSDILHIRSDVFERLVQKQLAFTAALTLDLSARLFIATSNERALAFSDVDTRLADVLLDYAQLCGVAVDNAVRLSLPLSQQALARDLGVSRKSLVRGLLRLKHDGIMDKDRGRYVIRDPKGLTERSSGGLALFYRLSDALKTRK